MGRALCGVARWLTAALWIVGGIASARPADAPLAFTTHGGDAWTYEKRIELTVAEGACDQVALASPVATLTKQPASGRVSARLPLAAGSNVVSAECLKGGASASEPITQRWLVRLTDAPVARMQVHVGSAGIVLDASESKPAPSRPTPIERYAWRVGASTRASVPWRAMAARASRYRHPLRTACTG